MPSSWNGFEPPSLSVAKPLHHTWKPKVGSGIGIRPEFNRNWIPIEAMEMDTLQGVGNLLLHQAQYLPVQRIRCLGAFPRDPDMQHQRHIWASKHQHPSQGTFLYTEGLSSLATVHPHLTQGSHSRGVHQLGQAIKIVIAKVTGMLWMYSHSYNPSLGEMQLLCVLRPWFRVTDLTVTG